MYQIRISSRIFGIKIIGSSALHPQGRGQIERMVRTVKTLLQKYFRGLQTQQPFVVLPSALQLFYFK